MNIIPTLEGGLRVDLEDRADWLLLSQLIDDACRREHSLADELGAAIQEPEVAEDWFEYVVPELKEQFATSLETVRELIADSIQQHEGGPGSLWITRELGFDWFSSLNQARLAIESRHGFGNLDREEIDEDSNDTRRSAYYRSQFYSALQGLLLEHVLD